MRDECEHGRLRRSCSHCAVVAERAELAVEVARLREALESCESPHFCPSCDAKLGPQTHRSDCLLRAALTAPPAPKYVDRCPHGHPCAECDEERQRAEADAAYWGLAVEEANCSRQPDETAPTEAAQTHAVTFGSDLAPGQPSGRLLSAKPVEPAFMGAGALFAPPAPKCRAKDCDRCFGLVVEGGLCCCDCPRCRKAYGVPDEPAPKLETGEEAGARPRGYRPTPKPGGVGPGTCPHGVPETHACQTCARALPFSDVLVQAGWLSPEARERVQGILAACRPYPMPHWVHQKLDEALALLEVKP